MKVLGLPYGIWMAAFTAVPMLLMAVYALRGESGFSLSNFASFFSPIYLRVLWDSAVIAFWSTAASLCIGYPAAYFISVMEDRQREFFLMLLILPTWMNFLLRTYSWMNLLGKNGLLNRALDLLGIGPANLLYNNGAVLLGMLYNFLPFMIYPIYSVLRKLNPSYLEAAKDLGASPWKAFWKITFPLSLPGVATGVTMVFMPAVSTFVIPELLGGAQKMYIGNLIQHQFLVKGDWGFGSAISIIMMFFILLAMYVMNRFAGDEKENALW
jgi:spermidine/putrescine transport system permease protein